MADTVLQKPTITINPIGPHYRFGDKCLGISVKYAIVRIAAVKKVLMLIVDAREQHDYRYVSRAVSHDACVRVGDLSTVALYIQELGYLPVPRAPHPGKPQYPL